MSPRSPHEDAPDVMTEQSHQSASEGATDVTRSATDERRVTPQPSDARRTEICASCGWTRDAEKNHLVRGASSPAEACDECRAWLFRPSVSPAEITGPPHYDERSEE